MADIKTKDTIKGTIKQLDRAAVASVRMKRAYIQTKDKAKSSVNASEDNPEQYAADHVENGVQDISHEVGRQVQKLGRNGVSRAKDDVHDAKQAVQEFQRVRTEQKGNRIKIKTRESQFEATPDAESEFPDAVPRETRGRRQTASKSTREGYLNMDTPDTSRAVEQGRKRVEQTVRTRRRDRSIRIHSQSSRTIKTMAQPARQVKETAKSSGEKSIKTTQKAVAKTARRGVKTAERTAKTTIKTSKEAAKAAEKSAKATAKAAPRAAHAAKATAKAAVSSVKAAVKVTASAIKAIIAATKALISAIVAGGWIAMLMIVIIMLIGLIAGSSFGIFFSGEDSGTGQTMPMAIQEINLEYEDKLEDIKANNPHDILDLSASRAVWQEVLAVYAVKTTTDQHNGQDVATMDDSKKALLAEIFWAMNQISFYTNTVSYEVTETDADGEETTVTVTETTLYITVTGKTASEMADEYDFNDKQKAQLDELLQPEYQELFLGLVGNSADVNLTPEEIQNITAHFPAGLSEERKLVVLTAYQLLGKVNYFWGGKSLTLGWDSRWGTPMTVTAPGSSSTGTVRPFGLDCSGFVDWVFYNVSGGTYIFGQGGGTYTQHANSTNISWSEAIPGDVVFYPGDSHVGIVCGFDANGNVLIIHCASGYNNVVVTGQAGFTTVTRPRFYS